MECPHCHNKIEVPDLWEFFDCTHCGSSLQLENNELKILKTSNEKTAANQHPPPQEAEENLSSEISRFEELSQSTQDAENQTRKSVSDAAKKDFSEISHAEDPQSSENIPSNINEQAATDESETHSSPEEEDENLSNILDFENSPHPGNHFTYCLKISEISSKTLIDKIHRIFKNPRLKINSLPQIQNNTLAVNNLNAIQMVYILRKLSSLPVGICWRQKSTLK